MMRSTTLAICPGRPTIKGYRVGCWVDLSSKRQHRFSEDGEDPHIPFTSTHAWHKILSDGDRHIQYVKSSALVCLKYAQRLMF